MIASETKGLGEGHSYSEAFIEEYITRFEEDLQVIRSEKHLLNFVSKDSLDWFDSEVETLRQIANKNPSFQKKATDVVHNDLNWQNLLVNDNHACLRECKWDEYTHSIKWDQLLGLSLKRNDQHDG